MTPITLEGPTVTLVPLAESLFPALVEAALSAPDVFLHMPFPVRTRDDVHAILRLALDRQARGEAVTFATHHGGRVVGSTTVRWVDRSVPSAEIGATWLLPSVQRTRVNTEAKLLQLRHCFETLGCARVELKTDVRNLRSRTAIARLGACEEGVLRAHMRRADGSLRDSVLFSLVQSEWPAVETRLGERQPWS
jgi:RimJ/RimL family protein N-acetyltransferase